MAANFIQEEELFNGNEQEDVQDVTTPVPDSTGADNTEVVDKSEPVEELPEKYRGKSAIDIAKMHQEAEKLIGRQANEVHEVRSLADRLLKQQLDSKAREAKPIEESLENDFFADPASAVNRQVEKHPAVLEARQAALEMKRMKTAQQLASKHPDYATIASDAGFQDWVRSSAIRLNLFARADTEFDFDSADELLSTYKELKQIKQYNQQTQTAAVESKAQDQAMRAATVDVGGAGETSRKVYRRADLIKLRMTDPDRYMQMSDEIMAAYSEGRVK
jgi:outer membrane protein OmpA-like peptidoglycan-associated protein